MKEYYADVRVSWGTSFEAKSKDDFVIKLKQQFKQDYNIELIDKEIHELVSDPSLNLKPSFINYEKFYNLTIPSTAKRIEFPFTQIYIQDNFLSEENCEIAIKQMCEELVPSTVANEDDDIVHSDYRTSSTSGFDYRLSDVGTDLNEVIANYMGLDCLFAEWLQAQRYLPGEFYKAHHDYFPRFTTEYKIYTEWMGQRTWTFMVYLNDVEEGGETYFKHLNLKLNLKRVQQSFGIIFIKMVGQIIKPCMKLYLQSVGINI